MDYEDATAGQQQVADQVVRHYFRDGQVKAFQRFIEQQGINDTDDDPPQDGCPYQLPFNNCLFFQMP